MAKPKKQTIKYKKCDFCSRLWSMRYRVCGLCGADLQRYSTIVER